MKHKQPVLHETDFTHPFTLSSDGVFSLDLLNGTTITVARSPSNPNEIDSQGQYQWWDVSIERPGQPAVVLDTTYRELVMHCVISAVYEEGRRKALADVRKALGL